MTDESPKRPKQSLEARLRELIDEWRERGVIEPYGMTWHPPADELAAVVDEYDAAEPERTNARVIDATEEGDE